MSGLSRSVPRVIALIDLSDLRWQVKRMGAAFGHDVTAAVERLEAGLARLAPPPAARLPLGVVYVYSPLDTDRPRESALSGPLRAVFRQQVGGAKRECWSCHKACTHCQAATGDSGGQGGGDHSLAADLIVLAREDEYDWAVVVSMDLRLIPVVRYVQSHGRTIIHGCFPPLARDLTEECWASIDLRALGRARE